MATRGGPLDGIDPALAEQLKSGGVFFVFAATFLSCLGLPIPAALVLLGAGALIALGEQPLLVTLRQAGVGESLQEHDPKGQGHGHNAMRAWGFRDFVDLQEHLRP